MKKLLIVLPVLFLIIAHAAAHPWKPDHYVVIDTDCGLDDFRTIRLMLESSNIRVLAITASNGVVNAQDGYFKIKNLLKTNHHEGILVGANLNPEAGLLDCEVALNFAWGDYMNNNNTQITLYSEVLNQVFNNSNEKIIFINLGSLNTVNEYLSEFPEYRENIKEVIWTSDYDEPENSFNYETDTSSYHSFLDLNIPFSIINNGEIKNYTDPLIEKIKILKTPFSSEILKSLTIENSIFSRNFYDESAFLYLIKPELFTQRLLGDNLNFTLKPDEDAFNVIMDSIFSIPLINTQVLSFFPENKSNYVEDVQELMSDVIRNYGREEWAACVLTCEIHRHVGVYTLIGAKMGVRAREYFGAGLDELKIVSYAGLEPPFSCLNDGLQVSSGATLGHGLISVKENTNLPKADFYYLGQKITINLKEEYRKQVASQIRELSYIYGLDSNIYWDLVRDIALMCWKDWNRHDVFNIKK